jgi:hypothetical protein
MLNPLAPTAGVATMDIFRVIYSVLRYWHEVGAELQPIEKYNCRHDKPPEPGSYSWHFGTSVPPPGYGLPPCPCYARTYVHPNTCDFPHRSRIRILLD